MLPVLKGKKWDQYSLKMESKERKMDKCKTKTKITATGLCRVKNGKVFQRKDYPYHYINNFLNSHTPEF